MRVHDDSIMALLDWYSEAGTCQFPQVVRDFRSLEDDFQIPMGLAFGLMEDLLPGTVHLDKTNVSVRRSDVLALITRCVSHHYELEYFREFMESLGFPDPDLGNWDIKTYIFTQHTRQAASHHNSDRLSA